MSNADHFTYEYYQKSKYLQTNSPTHCQLDMWGLFKGPQGGSVLRNQ